MKNLIVTIASSLFILSQLPGQITDYHVGLETAKASGKNIVLLFTAEYCANGVTASKELEREELRALLGAYEVVSLNVSDDTPLKETQHRDMPNGTFMTLRTKGNVWADLEVRQFNSRKQPLLVLIDSDGNILKEPISDVISKETIERYLMN